MNALWIPIIVPVLFGIACFVVPRKWHWLDETLALIGSLGTLAVAAWLFGRKPVEWTFGDVCYLRLDALSGFISLAAGLFGFLIVLYSIRFMQGHAREKSYYGYLLLTLGSAFGVLFANHFILFLVFWGFLGITLYLLILMGGENAAAPAKKTLILIGGSDALMLLGIILLHSSTMTFEIHKTVLPLQGSLAYTAFITLLIGAFAKAGAMPFHTWIPDMAETAPMPVTAYLPASLDKLLGIYLLARLCLSIFQLSGAAHLILMIVGAFTILAAVMMALVQHDLRRLLAYHAVSQVGYMVLGIGTGNPIGIAGGLFHMLNHSIYKACLFLSGGAVQYRTDQTDLDQLGGLGKAMPITFLSFLIGAFSISGVPPFNGFASKWMIYQGLITAGQNGDKIWMLWLMAALFGSALTLASFMKLTHAIFLGVPSPLVEGKKVKEVGFGMTTPMVVLSALCVLFGIFAYSIPLKYFIMPVIPDVAFSGLWSPGWATLLILLGLALGLFIFALGNLKSIRRSDSFIGGEKLPPENRITGTQFYLTIQNFKGLKKPYAWAEAKFFDIYEQGAKFVFWVAGFFRRAHTGVLTMYMLWVFLGLIALLYFMMPR
jgi:formate hydrogenlyase subunit 3/multisubunit Na+/H+ antiporter MnhD subunit